MFMNFTAPASVVYDQTVTNSATTIYKQTEMDLGNVVMQCITTHYLLSRSLSAADWGFIHQLNTVINIIL